MKALLVVLIINNNGNAGIRTVEVPVKDMDYCLSIAEPTGAAIANSLGTWARQVSTECIQTWRD